MIDENLMRRFMEIAERMIFLGAEVSRVEESLTYMCTAYGAVRTDAFVTMSNMTLNVENSDGTTLSASRRLKTGGFDVEGIHKMNTLVRYITHNCPDAEAIDQKFEEAKVYKKYKSWHNILFSILVAGSFTVYFGSRDLVEIALSSFIGGIVAVVNHYSQKVNLSGMMIRFLCSALFSFMAFVSLKLGWIPNPDYIIMGNIMTLIPGCGITSALRDLFTGDTFTGILRTIQAVLYAASLAMGYIAIAYLFGGAI